jgi:hypothetical protein
LINYTEWIAATLEAHGQIEEDRIAEAFDRLDVDNTGFITKHDLREILGASVSSRDIDSIIRASDINKDGKISYDEFSAAFRTDNRLLISQVSGLDPQALSDSDDELVGIDAVIPGGKHGTVA